MAQAITAGDLAIRARMNGRDEIGQLATAFSKIAGELSAQYSLGYYPKTAPKSGERRLIKVVVNQPDLAVRARQSYVQRVLPQATQ